MRTSKRTRGEYFINANSIIKKNGDVYINKKKYTEIVETFFQTFFQTFFGHFKCTNKTLQNNNW